MREVQHVRLVAVPNRVCATLPDGEMMRFEFEPGDVLVVDMSREHMQDMGPFSVVAVESINRGPRRIGHLRDGWIVTVLQIHTSAIQFLQAMTIYSPDLASVGNVVTRVPMHDHDTTGRLYVPFRRLRGTGRSGARRRYL